jgi:dihydrofolate synthase/folylpolyglutamate synthase
MRADLIAADPLERELAGVLDKLALGYGPERDSVPSLDSFWPLLAELGDPQLRLPPAVHVAGTNGKGSTVAFVRALAEAAGLKVHVFTSPHLVTFRERIRLAGALVGVRPLLSALARALGGVKPGVKSTYFELTTAAAFLLFSETPADLLILEVGLGGRLDATNVIPAPLAAVVTPIAFDHMARLGNTLTLIAGEKAGIFKPGSEAVIAPQVPEALTAIEARALAMGLPRLKAGVDWQATGSAEAFSYARGPLRLSDAALGLAGPHQAQNAGTALTAASVALSRLNPARSLDAETAARGLATARWPARMQLLREGPLTDAARGCEVWLDGAHNPAGMATLVAATQALPPASGHLGLVFAAHGDKDVAGMLRGLLGTGAHVVGVPLPGTDRGFEPAKLRDVVRKDRLALQTDTAASIVDAVALLVSLGAGRVVIAGSLLLAGQALIENREDIA